MPKHEFRFLALGDSYTIGEGVAASECWPAQLVERLRQRGVSVADPTLIAKTGWTTDELKTAIAGSQLDGSFDLVSLLIGVNNQYRGRTVENYRVEFRELLRIAIDYADGRNANVVVVSIPDWGATPFAAGRDRQKIAVEIDVYNEVNRVEAMRAGARYVEVTSSSRQALEMPDYLASDGLHPSAQMYEAWVDLILPEVLKVVEK